MGKKIEINLPANLRFSALIRNFSENIFSFTGFSKEWKGRLKLVIDELFMNAVRYGSIEDKSTVHMVFSYDDEKVEFSISDEGKDSNKITADELKKLIDNNIKNTNITRTSGRGLALITNLWTDKLVIEKSEYGGIKIVFSKSIETIPPTPPPLIQATILSGDKQTDPLTQEKNTDDKTFSVKLYGEIDPFNIEKTVIPVNEKIASLPKGATLVLDFKNLKYINSTFIGNIASWYNAVHQKKGRIVLKNTHNQIKDILDLVGLSKVLVFDS